MIIVIRKAFEKLWNLKWNGLHCFPVYKYRFNLPFVLMEHQSHIWIYFKRNGMYMFTVYRHLKFSSFSPCRSNQNPIVCCPSQSWVSSPWCKYIGINYVFEISIPGEVVLIIDKNCFASVSIQYLIHRSLKVFWEQLQIILSQTEMQEKWWLWGEWIFVSVWFLWKLEIFVLLIANLVLGTC